MGFGSKISHLKSGDIIIISFFFTDLFHKETLRQLHYIYSLKEVVY